MLRRFTRRAVQFMRRATDESIRADVIGALFLLGALLGAISLILPHPDQGELGIWAVVVAATATGVALIWRSTRWSTPAIHGAVAFGSVCINVMTLSSGVASGVYAAMFSWVVLISVNFFSLRAAALHFAWLMGTFALVLTVVEEGSGYSAFTRWLVVALALAVTGGATAWLVYRRRLAEEATDRFFDLSQEMLCTVGVDGCLARVNRAWERTLGYPSHSLRSRSILELLHPDDRAEMEAGLEELKHGNSSLSLENRMRHGDGSYQRMHWSASFSADEGLVYARIRAFEADVEGVESRTLMQAGHGARSVLPAARDGQDPVAASVSSSSAAELMQ